MPDVTGKSLSAVTTPAATQQDVSTAIDYYVYMIVLYITRFFRDFRLGSSCASSTGGNSPEIGPFCRQTAAASLQDDWFVQPVTLCAIRSKADRWSFPPRDEYCSHEKTASARPSGLVLQIRLKNVQADRYAPKALA